MLTVAEAGEIILAAVAPRAPRAVPLAEAAECVLAADVVTPIDLPMWDNSAVDGYALRSADVTGANENNPIHLRVSPEKFQRVKRRRSALEPQTCLRIFTGAPIPGRRRRSGHAGRHETAPRRLHCSSGVGRAGRKYSTGRRRRNERGNRCARRCAARPGAIGHGCGRWLGAS